MRSLLGNQVGSKVCSKMHNKCLNLFSSIMDHPVVILPLNIFERYVEPRVSNVVLDFAVISNYQVACKIEMILLFGGALCMMNQKIIGLL